MKILSKAERDAELKKRAEEATLRANQSPADEKKKTATFEKIKDSLQKMGYAIKDEDGLKEIIGSDTSLKYDKIGILAQRGIISLNEEELDNSKPQEANIYSISEDNIPAPQEQHTQKAETRPKAKETPKSKEPVVFSISEADIPAPQKQHSQKAETQPKTEVHPQAKQDTRERINRQIEEQRQKHLQATTSSQLTPDNNAHKQEPASKQETTSKQEPASKQENASKQETAPKVEQKQPQKDNSSQQEPPSFEKKYAKSLEQWCQKNTDKKTGKIKREVKEVQQTIINSEKETQIKIAPLSPIAAKRGDNGAVYRIKKGSKPNHTDVTLGSSEPGKPLNYDYFYALVKAAHDSGADTIEFNNIKTPEFRDKLLAAALQFKMKLKNPPGAINLNAPHLQSIPPGCRHYLELHNESVKKALQKMGKEITPEKGSKFGTGPKAEERTHAEKVFIESEIARLKAQKAEKARIAMEKRLNFPSQEDYDQHPEKYIKNQQARKKPKNKLYLPQGKTR